MQVIQEGRRCYGQDWAGERGQEGLRLSLEDWVAIVCGARSGPPLAVGLSWATKALDAFDRERRIAHVVQGGASGIDAIAAGWAKIRRRTCTTFWANWHAYGRRAGPRRNAEMAGFLLRIASSGRRVCLAFPGSEGTQSMVQIALAAGIPVWRCELVGADGFAWTQTLALNDPPV